MRRFDFESEYERDLERYQGMDVDELRGYASRLFEAGDLEAFYRVMLGNKAYMQACLLRFYDNTVYLNALNEAIGQFEYPLSEDDLQVLVNLWAAEHICKTKFNEAIHHWHHLLPVYVWLGYGDIFEKTKKLLQEQDSYHRFIAAHLAKKGDLEQALQVAQQIVESSYRELAYSSIMKTLLEQSKPVEAMELIHHLKSSYEYPRLLCELAEGFLTIDQERAASLLDEAVKLVESHEAFKQSPQILSQIGAVYQQIDAKRSEKLFKHVLDIVQETEATTNRIAYLCSIAEAFHKVNDPRANELLNEAYRLYEGYEIRKEDGLMIGLIALAFLDCENPRATLLFEEVWEAVEQTKDDPWLYQIVLDRLAQELAKRGYIEQALGCAQRLSGHQSSGAYSAVVRAMVEAGRVDEAIDLVRGFDAYERLLQCQVMSNLAVALSIQNDPRAAETLDEAVEYSQTYGFNPSGLILRHLAKSGHIDEALDLIVNPLTEYKDIIDPTQDNLQTLVEIVVEQGQFEQALEIVNLLDRDKVYYEQAMGKIAVGYAKQGDFDRANDILSKMNAKGYPHHEVLVEIGVHRAKLGQFNEARAIAEWFAGQEQPSPEQEMMKFFSLMANAVGQAQKATGGENNADEILDNFQAEYKTQADTDEHRLQMALMEASIGASHTKEYAALQIAIAEQLVIRGNVEAGLKIVRQFEFPQHRAQGVSAIAAIFDKGKHSALWEAAFEDGKMVQDEKEKISVLVPIVKGYCQASTIEAVREIIRKILPASLRVPLLVHVAGMTRKENEIDDILNEVISNLTRIRRFSNRDHDRVGQTLIGDLCDYGYPNKAREIVDRIVWTSNEHGQLRALMHVARGYAKRDEWVQAFGVLREFRDADYGREWRENASAFLKTIVEWDLPLPIVLDVVRIMGWERRLWRQVYEKLR